VQPVQVEPLLTGLNIVLFLTFVYYYCCWLSSDCSARHYCSSIFSLVFDIPKLVLQIYRVAHKSLDKTILFLNVEFRGTFAPLCIYIIFVFFYFCTRRSCFRKPACFDSILISATNQNYARMVIFGVYVLY